MSTAMQPDTGELLILLEMGTIHRFPDQWLIVGIIYPPKPAPTHSQQLGLSLGQ
jgi:hypothetical protein